MICGNEVPSGSCASFRRSANQQNRLIPSGLPTSRPAIMPSGRMDVSPSIVTPCNETPALAKANSGRIRYATHGCRTCSRRFAGERPCFSFNGMKKPTITPASVAWTPDFSTAVHSIAPMRMYTPVRRTPHRFRIASNAMANAATPSETIDRSLV
ncbi:hypothetical protein SDC9_207179 [bioreactor metagenome]|uniref:Uncharacterized protein n=1 Tax=bioreactor metagenome TaxID=1076179 RepID=A0A645J723_9ZZZZ